MNAALMAMCLAGSVTAGQERELLFRAPHTEVRADRYGDRPVAYVMFHGTYIGSNYAKPPYRAQYGNPKLDFSRLPTTYYHAKSPVGVALQKFNWFPGPANTYYADARFPASMIGLDPCSQLVNLWSEPPIAVVGLEVGTLASYARPGQTVHFVSREPNFVKLAVAQKEAKPIFCFIDDALKRGAGLTVFEGDLRSTFAERGGEKFYHLISVDFYKEPDYTVFKDLLTKEGVEMLMGKLQDDGVLCFHLSNRFYDHQKTLSSAVHELRLECVLGLDFDVRHGEGSEPTAYSSEWLMVARKKEHFRHLKTPAGYPKDTRQPFWSPAALADKRLLWTDGAENSFRGVYRSDPDVYKIHTIVWDLERFLVDDIGVPFQPVHAATRPVHDWFWAWGDRSAQRLNREIPTNLKKR